MADRIVTTSPDVTVSTNLGGWVNQRGLFHRNEKDDAFKNRKIPSAQKWIKSPNGQHLELGMVEYNLFLNLAALGLSHRIFGERLFPIGTLYDPFQDKGIAAHIYKLLNDIPTTAKLVTVLDGHPTTLAWLGSIHGHRVTPLGVNTFGQTGSVQDLYKKYGIDTKAITKAAITKF